MRLDVFLFERGYVNSRTEAKNFISEGAVTVGGKVIKKPAFDINPDSEDVTVDTSGKKYVSRGGLKLEGALEYFSVSVLGKSALDVGASSGGFTDCLLKHGATRVLSVDSGEGQLVESIRRDKRVYVYENFNARYMTPEDFPYVPDICVMDVSFISATYIIPAIYNCLSDKSEFICLIKPQFEVGKERLSKGGIVKDEAARKYAIDRVVNTAKNVGFEFMGLTESPIKGGDGNTEYLTYFKKRPLEVNI